MKTTTTTDEERQEAYASMLEAIGTGECATIASNGLVRMCGETLGTIGREFPDHDAAIKAINAEMQRQQYWPDIYEISDHGNVSLLNDKGNEVASWV